MVGFRGFPMSRQKWLTRSPEFSRQYAKLSGKDKAVIRSSGLLMPSILTSNQCGQVFDFLERPRTRAPPQVLVFVFSGKPVRVSRRSPPKAPAACPRAGACFRLSACQARPAMPWTTIWRKVSACKQAVSGRGAWECG